MYRETKINIIMLLNITGFTKKILKKPRLIIKIIKPTKIK